MQYPSLRRPFDAALAAASSGVLGAEGNRRRESRPVADQCREADGWVPGSTPDWCQHHREPLSRALDSRYGGEPPVPAATCADLVARATDSTPRRDDHGT